MNTTLIILLIFVPILALILLGLNTLLAPKNSYESKLSQYECGMPAFAAQTRESFQIHFVVVAMLFLVFDLELVLLLPLGVTLSKVSTFGFAVAVLFFLILTIGFVLELSSNAISISPNNNNSHSNPLPPAYFLRSWAGVASPQLRREATPCFAPKGGSRQGPVLAAGNRRYLL